MFINLVNSFAVDIPPESLKRFHTYTIEAGEAKQILQNVPLPPPLPPTGAWPAATAGGCGHPHLLQPSLLR